MPGGNATGEAGRVSAGCASQAMRSWELRGMRDGGKAPASTAGGNTRGVVNVHASVGL